jgi:hypothetical protein
MMPEARLRRLSREQAARCEHSPRRQCRCRCGGACHGRARALDDVGPLDVHAPAFYARWRINAALRSVCPPAPQQPELFARDRRV